MTLSETVAENAKQGLLTIVCAWHKPAPIVLGTKPVDPGGIGMYDLLTPDSFVTDTICDDCLRTETARWLTNLHTSCPEGLPLQQIAGLSRICPYDSTSGYSDYEYVLSLGVFDVDWFVGPPRPTTVRSSEELLKLGFIGIFLVTVGKER